MENVVKETVKELWRERQNGEEWEDAPTFFTIPFYEEIQHTCDVFARKLVDEVQNKRIQ